MITRAQHDNACRRAAEMIRNVGVVVLDDDFENFLILDFGLGELEQFGLQILELVVTPTLTVKLIAMFPNQVCPQHRHSPFGDSPGKEESFRCEWGEVYVMLPGEPTPNPKAAPPAHRGGHFTSWREIVLRPGEHVTSPPNTPHWIQAGPDGAVLWTYETKTVDDADIFTDPDASEKTARTED